MKKLFVSLLIGIILFSGNLGPIHLSAVNVKAETPAYAKWGKIAMLKTKEKYPNAAIVDYLHVGRVSGTNTTTEKFKLWLKEQNKEFGVLVNIEFDNKSERVVDITLTVVAR